jgi:ligand-binding SRPBCC domain-containing protein
MFEHLLKDETFVPRPRVEVFDFFSAAANLERITPPELGFHVTSPDPIEMREGTLIDYRLRLFGVPFGWNTLISTWDPPRRFVDEQLTGPYHTWIHTHSFEEVEGGTRVMDLVRYRLPFAPLGEVAHPLVRLQLKRIFSYRGKRLRELMGVD